MSPNEDGTVSRIVIEMLRQYSKKFEQIHELARYSRTSLRSRYVWFVAICGYVLMNGPSYWKYLIGKDLDGPQVFWLSLPWMIAAVMALVANLFADEVENQDHCFYIAKAAALDLLVIRASFGDEVTEDQIVEIIDDKIKEIAIPHSKAEKRRRIERWIGRFTVALIFLSFMWAIFGPVMLRGTAGRYGFVGADEGPQKQALGTRPPELRGDSTSIENGKKE